jgi:hypothetical protein
MLKKYSTVTKKDHECFFAVVKSEKPKMCQTKRLLLPPSFSKLNPKTETALCNAESKALQKVF